jgi:hypothetical protein
MSFSFRTSAYHQSQAKCRARPRPLERLLKAAARPDDAERHGVHLSASDERD